LLLKCTLNETRARDNGEIAREKSKRY